MTAEKHRCPVNVDKVARRAPQTATRASQVAPKLHNRCSHVDAGGEIRRRTGPNWLTLPIIWPVLANLNLVDLGHSPKFARVAALARAGGEWECGGR